MRFLTPIELENRLKQPVSSEEQDFLIKNGIRNMVRQDHQKGISIGSQKGDPSLSHQNQLHIELMEKVIKRLKQLGYVWLKGSTANQTAKSFVYCFKHKTISEMTLSGLSGGSDKRPRNANGAPCCSQEQHLIITRAFALTRKKPYEQRVLERKAKKAAMVGNVKPLTPAEKKIILDLWGNRCAITGLTDSLQIHHLYSTNTYPSLSRIIPNCIVIHSSMHTLFHQIFYNFATSSYMPCTSADFLFFVRYLHTQHKVCSIQTKANYKPQTDSKWHSAIVTNCKILIPKLRKINRLLLLYCQKNNIIL